MNKNLLLSMRAHNHNAEDATFNDDYNLAHGLGTFSGRQFCKSIAIDKHGCYGGKITKSDIEKYIKLKQIHL